jgi:hypothetical protein
MALRDMGEVVYTWCVTGGFVFDRAPPHVSGRRERSGRMDRPDNEEAGREGDLGPFLRRSSHPTECSRCDPENHTLRVTDDVAAYSA